jgi:hypothetical protein
MWGFPGTYVRMKLKAAEEVSVGDARGDVDLHVLTASHRPKSPASLSNSPVT